MSSQGNSLPKNYPMDVDGNVWLVEKKFLADRLVWKPILIYYSI